MKRAALATGLLAVMFQSARAADRPAEFARLVSEYQAAEKEFFEIPINDDATVADKIRRLEAWPGWKYLPRFLELAQSQPDDEISFKCCVWICDRTRNVGNRLQPIFDADQQAWEILARHHTGRADLPMVCLRGADYIGPAREQFLRELVNRKDLSRENRGFATIGLAEMLAKKYDQCERPQDDEVAAPRDEFAKYAVDSNSKSRS